MINSNIATQLEVDFRFRKIDYLKSIKRNMAAMQEDVESQDSTATSGAAEVRLYALTATYSSAKDIDLEKRILWIKQQHEKLYFHILETILPYYSKPKRKRLQPISYNFIDMPGMRKQHVDELKAPHVHSLVIMHPKLVNKFEELIMRNFLINGGMLNSKLKLTNKMGLQALKEQCESIKFTEKPSKSRYVQNIDCPALGESDCDITRWISYSAKFLESNYAKFVLDEDTRSELFDMLPKYRGLNIN